MKAYGGGRDYGRKMVADLICLLGFITRKIRYLTRCYFFYICFLLVCILGEKLASRVVVLVLFYRIKLDLTNRVGNKKEF